MTETGGAETRETLIGIQTLRAAAALMVLFGHLQTEVAQHSPGFAPLPYAWGAGVDVFFVISGLIMVISSQSLFGSIAGSLSFIQRRLIRVVPIYWFYTTLAVAMVFILPGRLNTMRWDEGVIAASYLFVPVYRWDGAIRPLLSLGWTLNYEMFFYVLFAATLWMRPIWLSTATLVTALIAFAVLGMMFNFRVAPLEFWFNNIILEFVLGMLLGWTYVRRPRFRSAWLLLLVAAGFLAFAIHPFGGLPRFLDRGLPAALIVAGALWGLSDDLSRLLQPIADWLGESSYSLYLSHPFSVGLIVMLWPLRAGQWNWALVIVGTLGALAAGIASHRLIEAPATGMLRARFAP